jgi:hypothetical protein
MLRVIGCILFLLLSLAGASAQVTPVEAPGPPSTAGKPEVPSEAQQSMCLLLESAARANGLPVDWERACAAVLTQCIFWPEYNLETHQNSEIFVSEATKVLQK